MLDLLRGVREYIYPVGRLDYDSEGLLLLTNDGELAARLTHPRHEVDKVYEARVRGVPDEHVLERLAKGVTIDGKRTAPAKVRVLDPPEETSVRERPDAGGVGDSRGTPSAGQADVRRGRPSRRPPQAGADRANRGPRHAARPLAGADASGGGASAAHGWNCRHRH